MFKNSIISQDRGLHQEPVFVLFLSRYF